MSSGMEFRSNLHTHTLYSDGKNTAEDLILAAIGQEFISIGFSDHSPITVDGKDRSGKDFSVSMRVANYPKYLAELKALREKYRGRIQVYVGLEEDFLPPNDRTQLDYVIGSVHYVQGPDGTLYTIDYLHESFLAAAEALGGVRQVVEAYFTRVGEIAARYHPELVGHFDLITKLNGDGRYFSTTEPWYRNAAGSSIEQIAKTGAIVEVNTGGIARGYSTEPYPSGELLAMMLDQNIPVTISSDCHQIENLACCFDQAAAVLKKVGYRSVKRLDQGVFEDVLL